MVKTKAIAIDRSTLLISNWGNVAVAALKTDDANYTTIIRRTLTELK